MMRIKATGGVTTERKTSKVLLIVVVLTTEEEAFRLIFAITRLSCVIHLYCSSKRLVGKVGCHTKFCTPQAFVVVAIELMTKEQFHVMMTKVMVVIHELLEVIREGLITCSGHNTRWISRMTVSIERLFRLSST